MEVRISAPEQYRDPDQPRWDWGMLAACLQQGHPKREFFQDSREQYDQHRGRLTRRTADATPARHAAVV
eukprot:5252370-Pyramimonas_sp.AAC.1